MTLTVIGAGGHAAVVLDVLLAGGHDVRALVDPDPSLRGSAVAGVPVIGGDEVLPALRRDGSTQAIVAVGDNDLRRRLTDLACSLGFTIVSAVHPSAVVARSAVIGAGTVVMPNVSINARARVGRGGIVNTNASVDHDCVIGDFVHVGPGARLGGRVRCGDAVLVGIGASVIPGIAIGDEAVVGAGAVVVRDVPEGATVIGIPARVRREAS